MTILRVKDEVCFLLPFICVRLFENGNDLTESISKITLPIFSSVAEPKKPVELPNQTFGFRAFSPRFSFQYQTIFFCKQMINPTNGFQLRLFNYSRQRCVGKRLKISTGRSSLSLRRHNELLTSVGGGAAKGIGFKLSMDKSPDNGSRSHAHATHHSKLTATNRPV